MASSIGEMSDRARDVFRLVVEAYLESGQPVGSRTISRTSSLNLSPASIRNVMQDLEETGLLAAPHTSAGRIPTESGLRLFVDAIMQVAEPRPEDRAAIESMIDRGGPIEEAIASTTAALSGLSACAGIVLVPKEEPALKQLAFVPLSARQAVAVVVGSDGRVENARAGAAMKIFIGSENELFALSGSSVIAAPWRGHDGKLVGVVGVIGPTRLNYARVVPMVDFTAKTLSRLMG